MAKCKRFEDVFFHFVGKTNVSYVYINSIKKINYFEGKVEEALLIKICPIFKQKKENHHKILELFQFYY